MTFSELALLMIGITTALPVMFYMLDQRDYTKEHALHINRNLATYVVIIVASFVMKIGPDVWAAFVSFFEAAGTLP